ncbi:hypothetical protein BDV98DRAFT_571570 [Pterulicium gracile]|uniref:Uncharacterized protein n=1 Tax=Pterulicium gracile TaxID=1884261 RepID=A0A5C3QFY1_9AGAR|nr:hypothetical protein BDV98DRAFT_571570 [Pterula gracilis]
MQTSERPPPSQRTVSKGLAPKMAAMVIDPNGTSSDSDNETHRPVMDPQGSNSHPRAVSLTHHNRARSPSMTLSDMEAIEHAVASVPRPIPLRSRLKTSATETGVSFLPTRSRRPAGMASLWRSRCESWTTSPSFTKLLACCVSSVFPCAWLI